MKHLLIAMLLFSGCAIPARANKTIDVLKDALVLEQQNITQLLSKVDANYQQQQSQIFDDMRATVVTKLTQGDMKKETILALIDDGQKQLEAQQLLQKEYMKNREKILDNIEGMSRLLDMLENTVMASQRIPPEIIELIKEKK